MEKKIVDVWAFLQQHKICNVEMISKVKENDVMNCIGLKTGDDLKSRVSFFERGLEIMIVMVDPLTESINTTDVFRNSEERVWLDLSTPYLEDGKVILSKDTEIDLCGSGKTFEDAVLSLAKKVKEAVGTDTTSSIFTIVD